MSNAADKIIGMIADLQGQVASLKVDVVTGDADIKVEMEKLRSDVTTALMTFAEKMDSTYVRKDVNDQKEREQDGRLTGLDTQQTQTTQTHLALKRRVDKFAVGAGTLAVVIAVFQDKIGALIKYLTP